MNRSENNEYRGMMRNVLKSTMPSGIIGLDREKEGSYGHDGRNAYNRRYSPYPPNIRIHCQGTMQEWGTQVQKSWQELESQTGGLESLYRQATGTRRQKIKPATCWQTTIENLVAFRSSALLWKVKANDPQNSLPVFSIHSPCQNHKVLCSGMGTR